MLESGRLHLDLDMGGHKEAVLAGREVLGLCTRRDLRLYEPDAELILARAYLAQKDFSQGVSQKRIWSIGSRYYQAKEITLMALPQWQMQSRS